MSKKRLSLSGRFLGFKKGLIATLWLCLEIDTIGVVSCLGCLLADTGLLILERPRQGDVFIKPLENDLGVW